MDTTLVGTPDPNPDDDQAKFWIMGGIRPSGLSTSDPRLIAWGKAWNGEVRMEIN